MQGESVVVRARVDDSEREIPAHYLLDRRAMQAAFLGADPSRAPDGRALAAAIERLDEVTREWLRGRVARENVSIEDGWVVVEAPADAWRRTLVEERLDLAVILANALAAPRARLVDALVESATEDPRPAVRVRSIETLRRDHARHPRADGAFQRGRIDADASVRLAASLALGAGAVDDLERFVLDAELPSDLRRRAFHEMLGLAREERSALLVVRLIDEARDDLLRRRAITAAGARRMREAVPALILRVGREDDVTAALAAEALERIEDPAAEAALVECLDRPVSRASGAAVKALHRIGTAASVEPLLLFAARAGVSAALSEAARAAVLAIQSRLKGAEQGQLSVAASPEPSGRLSLPAGSDGALTLPDDAPPIAPEVSTRDADDGRPQRRRTQ